MSLRPFALQDSFSSLLADKLAENTIELFSGVRSSESTITIASSLSESISQLQDVIKSLYNGPQFNTYSNDDEASIQILNSDVRTLRYIFISSLQNMIQLERQQLNTFNIDKQRAEFLLSKLSKLENQLTETSHESQKSKNTIVFSENFADLDFVDSDKSPSNKLPALQYGYVTLGISDTGERVDILDAEISIEKVNQPRLDYPSLVERPVGVIHEGRYYGVGQEVRPEGGKWNLQIKSAVPTDSQDLLGMAHDASTYLTEGVGDLEDILPRTPNEEPSTLSVTNLGWPESVIQSGRKNMLDGNPETFWEIELITVNNIEDKPTGNAVEVSFIVKLNQPVMTNQVSILPFMNGVDTDIKVDLSIGTSIDSLTYVYPLVQYKWPFPMQTIQYMRFEMYTEYAYETPYEVAVLNLKRVISHFTDKEIL